VHFFVIVCAVFLVFYGKCVLSREKTLHRNARNSSGEVYDAATSSVINKKCLNRMLICFCNYLWKVLAPRISKDRKIVFFSLPFESRETCITIFARDLFDNCINAFLWNLLSVTHIEKKNRCKIISPLSSTGCYIMWSTKKDEEKVFVI
jgi:hypothetical protein